MATLQQAFGAVLRRRRLAADLSQEALATAAGLHFTTISLLENGRRAPTIVVVRKLAVALQVSMAELFGEVEREVDADARRAGGKKKR